MTTSSCRTRYRFRIAAGPRMGFGHLMRARALAHALGVRPVVSLRGGPGAIRVAREFGCDVLPDGVDPCDRADVLVVDDPSPGHTQRWVTHARRCGIRSVAVHDGGPGYACADLVVDGSFSTPVASSSQTVLSGPNYYLLDRACRARARRARPSRKLVLVALGGGGRVRRVAGRLTEAIALASPGVDIVVAAGFVSSPLPSLRHGRWVIGRTALMRTLVRADLAVVAGGVSLYEMCAAGLPSIGVAVVPAQRKAIEAGARAGVLLDAGGPSIDRSVEARVGTLSAELLNDRSLRRAIGLRARRLVDGKGTERVARRIRALAAHQGA